MTPQIVLGQQQGAMTPDGKIEGQTPQPIVYGVISYTGLRSFNHVEPQQ
jgi:hypothetical protein